MPAVDFAGLLAEGHAALKADEAARAVGLLRRAVAAAPDHAGAQHLLGMALDRTGQAKEAAAALLRAMQLDPRRTEAAVHLAGILLRRGNRTGAAQVLVTAAAAAADVDPVAAHLCRAQGLGMMDRLAEAAAELRAVLARQPHHAEAWRLLGNTQAAAGDLAAARDAMRRAVALRPNDASTLLDLVRSGHVTEADLWLVARIEAELARETLPTRRQMLLGFALGKAYDDLGKRAEAMRAFDRANLVRAQVLPFEAARLVRDVDRTISDFPDAPPCQLENTRAVFIVGMPRSGTTLVEQILSSHPHVAAGGEMQFWGETGIHCWQQQREAGLEELRDAHARALDTISTAAARITDKNPFNFALLGLIRRVLPGAYIIHCRRDPRDLCLSAYMTLFSGGEAWAASRARLAFYYREYQRLMRHWRTVLPAERFLEIDYEATVAAPDAAARRLVAFCDLPWDDACLHPQANARPVHTASVYQVREAVHQRSVGKWRGYEAWLGELADLEP